MIVDSHVHVISPDRERYPLRSAPDFLSPSPGPWYIETPVSLEQLLAKTSAAGVERVVLVQAMAAYGYDSAYHADSAAQHPGRLAGICAVDPLATDGPDQLAYWVRERGVQGLRLTTRRYNLRIDDPRSFPLWERAANLRIPIGILTSPEHLHAIGAMAARFPSIAIALDHAAGIEGAANDADADALIDVAVQPNIYVKLTTVNLAPLPALGPAALARWRRIVAAFGAQRLMWGSNYPVSQEGTYANMVKLGQNAPLFESDEERRWYMSGTALQVWPSLAVS